MKKIPSRFTAYQKLVIVIVALIQFSVVLDFLIMAPLGNEMIKAMGLTTAQFGCAVSVYAFSAGASGLVVAGFADKYPRKTLLLFVFAGFTLGTLLCSLANTYPVLLLARIVAGIFGGIVFAMAGTIVADVFSFEQRGRVMSFVQLSFAACQIGGLPAGVFLSSKYGWHMPFLMITVMCLAIGVLIRKGFRSIAKPHNTGVNPLRHLFATVKQKTYALPYLTTVLLSLPAYMFFPFTAQFLVNNVGIGQNDLGFVYSCVGVFSAVSLPFIGKASDRFGKYQTFLAGNVITVCTLAVYIHFGTVPVWLVAAVTAVMYVGLLSRSVPSTALMTAVPSAKDRGAFMSINSSMQQIGGGLSTVCAGYIISRHNGQLVHFDLLGYICIAAMAVSCVSVYRISKGIVKRETVKETKERLLLASEAVHAEVA